MLAKATADGRPISYPGITDNTIIDAVNAALYRRPWAHKTVDVSDVNLYHYQDYAAAGQLALQFFNVAGQEGGGNWISNMPAANQLPVDHVFVCRAVAVNPIFSRTTAGAEVASGGIAEQHATAAAANTFFDNIDLHADLLRAGYLEVKVSDRVRVHGPDLTRWPAGRGVSVNGAALSGTFVADTLNNAIVNLNNGVPHRDAINWLHTPFIIWPQKTLRADLRWQAAIASTAAFTIGVELVGSLIRKF